MHLGALVTIGAVAPDNLTVLLIQNGVHAASGGQALTNAELDLAATGPLLRHRACRERGNAASILPRRSAQPHPAKAPRVLVLSTKPDIEVVRPPVALDPVLTKHRFMAAIGAPRYVPTLFGGGRLVQE